MTRHTNRTHARSATTVRNAERFVKIEVTYVSTDSTRTRESYLRVHISSVHVHLTSVLMNSSTNLLNRFLKNTMGRRISHHQTCEIFGMLGSSIFQVIDVDISFVITFDQDDFHTRHYGRSWIGSVGRSRDQSNIAMRIAIVQMKPSDHHQTCKFTLST